LRLSYPCQTIREKDKTLIFKNKFCLLNIEIRTGYDAWQEKSDLAEQFEGNPDRISQE